MNTKKKIIYTLRSADKDSVEKLMADAAKKEEIFARIKERTEKDSEYTDVAEGVEKYSRRMKISHTASAAAASLLLIAGTYGAIRAFNSGKGGVDNHIIDSSMTSDITDNSNNAATAKTSFNTETATSGVTSVNANVTGVTAAVTADATADKTTAATLTTAGDEPDVTTTEEAQQPDNKEAGEQLREKCIGAVYNYDRFSADYTLNKRSGSGSFYCFSEGSVKLDNSSMTGEMQKKRYVSDGRLYGEENYYYLNDKFAYAGDFNTRGLLARISKTSTELESEEIKDRVYFKEYTGMNQFTSAALNGSQWEVTGESYENGRKITSASIKYENSSLSYTADFDAETGVCLAYDKYENGELTEYFRTSDYRFGDEAGAPMTEHEVRVFLEDNGYASIIAESLCDYQVSDLN